MKLPPGCRPAMLKRSPTPLALSAGATVERCIIGRHQTTGEIRSS